MTATPPVGNQVYDVEGTLVGSVRELSGPAFLVEPERGGDGYWLSSSLITRSDEAGTVLEFSVNELGAFQMEAPMDAKSQSPELDEQIDAFDSPGEQERTREAMKEGYPDRVEPPMDTHAKTEQRDASQGRPGETVDDEKLSAQIGMPGIGRADLDREGGTDRGVGDER